MRRRDVLAGISLTALAPAVRWTEVTQTAPLTGMYKHSVCRWCYEGMTLEKVCDMAEMCGVQSVELLNVNEWNTVLSRGLDVALANGSSLGIPRGFNDPTYHAQLQNELIGLIPLAADKGVPQIIVFSGNRNGLSDEQGIENCAVGLDPVLRVAEKYNIRIVMELLNSKIDHADYQCDRTAWGVALVEKLGSAQFKLLYDIYHMQIMEGDVIRTITRYKDYIGHYHTAGVPGRHEIDGTQELHYPAIMRAIASTGFDGYVAQEFIPKSNDPVRSLRDGVRQCTI